MLNSCSNKYGIDINVVIESLLGDHFPGGPVVKTPCFHCRVCGFDPGLGK